MSSPASADVVKKMSIEGMLGDQPTQAASKTEHSEATVDLFRAGAQAALPPQQLKEARQAAIQSLPEERQKVFLEGGHQALTSEERFKMGAAALSKLSPTQRDVWAKMNRSLQAG